MPLCVSSPCSHAPASEECAELSSVHFSSQAPEGESQPMTEVDLFISTQRIKVLNADTQVVMSWLPPFPGVTLSSMATQRLCPCLQSTCPQMLTSIQARRWCLQCLLAEVERGGVDLETVFLKVKGKNKPRVLFANHSHKFLSENSQT